MTTQNNYGFPLPYQQGAAAPVVAQRAPTTADTHTSSGVPYQFGQLWDDQSIDSIWSFADVSGGNAVWVPLGGGSSDVNTLTADDATIAVPAGGTITVSGGTTGLTTTASGSTLSLLGTLDVDNGGTGASSFTDHSVLVGSGTDPISTTNVGTAGQVLTSNGPGFDPSFQTAAGGTTADYADFYALMPGDNAATIAVGAAILLPQDGPSSGTSITRLTSSTFNLADIATYSVSFQCSFDEAGQWVLKLDTTELAYTVSGRATGTNQAYINVLVTTTTTNQVLSVVNPTGNSTALTITPIAGGTNAVSAHLVIQRVAGGPGGGLLNTINSVVPVSGNIDMVGTADQITVTPGAGIVTFSTPAAFIAPGSIEATTTLTATLGDITATNGDLVLGTAGNKLSIAAGANASVGTSAVLAGTPGTVTVATTAVTSSSIILISRNTPGGTLGNLSVPAASIIDGTSFVINSDANETSTVNWLIIN